MDTTGSPWDAPHQSDNTETGWADFGAFPSSGNDSGASDIIENQPGVVMSVEDRPEEGEEEAGDTWRPSMASSPEATMLDVTAEDVEGEKENEEDAPTEEIKKETTEEPKKEETKEDSNEESKKDEVTEKVNDEKENLKDESKDDKRLLNDESSPVEENKDELTENFAFLSDKGLITSDSSNNSSSTTALTQE